MGKIETGKISEVIIYNNGIKIEEKDLKNMVITNPIILAILQKANERIATNIEKLV